MKLPITKYGRTELGVSALICVVLGMILFYVAPLLVLIPVIMLGGVLYFFRDPERKIPSSDNIILAPADGKIIEIKENTGCPYFKEPALKIVIFLSMLDVHVNRAPCTGRIVSVQYKKGRFLVASNPKATEVNESNTIMIDCEKTSGLKVVLRQIAGIIARRIVCVFQVNDRISLGERIGMIKFGSRAEIYFPQTRLLDLEVKLGNKVKGGETILCRVKS